ncbi:MAG: hypothetical protein AAGB10_17610 [Pseudomonadota bacterium]
MKPSRRTILLGAGAAAVGSGGYLALQAGELADRFAEIFGDKVASLPAARSFVRDYQSKVLLGQANPIDQAMARSFILSTNFMEHHASGEPLAYEMLYDPYEHPCSNVLSAFYAPDGEHV